MNITKALYGAKNTFIDVTNIVLKQLETTNTFTVCNKLFTDPIIDVEKELIIEHNNGYIKKTKENNIYVSDLSNKKILITGTGRCGTTFLIKLFSFLNLDTGYNMDNYKKYIYNKCNSGMERQIDENFKILKNPVFMENITDIIKTTDVKYVIIPIRNYEISAKSRVAHGDLEGGLWNASDENEQIIYYNKIMSEYLYNMVECNIPTIFLSFEKMVTDPKYLYDKLCNIMTENHVSYEAFLKSYVISSDTSKPTKSVIKFLSNVDEKSAEIQLNKLHENIKIKYGNLKDEHPEQIMSVMCIKPSDRVLEIGGNIGRNSLVIASLLEEQSNLVVMECDINIAKQLQENKELNNLKFQIENSALSKRKLIQKGWDTMPSDVLKPGYKWVPTIILDDLKIKYQINFNVLVLDCEGAFYYILLDMPEILNGINTIIMENDYHDIEHKKAVDAILQNNGFINVYRKSGGWQPCYECFFEIWKK